MNQLYTGSIYIHIKDVSRVWSLADSVKRVTLTLRLYIIVMEARQFINCLTVQSNGPPRKLY